MFRVLCVTAALSLASTSSAQTSRPIPRPPVQTPPATESAAPEGYAPIPEWAGQTRAPKPAKTAAFDVETFATGIAAGFSFHFLPDGRIILSERPGRIRIVAKDGKVSDPIGGMPPNFFAAGGQGLNEAAPDRDFAKNRVVYVLYTVLPDGKVPDPPQRSPGILTVASAHLSADDRRLDDVRVLLNAEGTGGRLIQAPDGTLFITSTVPAGAGIVSTDWMQPQQFDSNMGKVLRINPDGSIPKDNPFVGRVGAHPEIYALGFRDDQGVAINPRTGKLWISEHGPRGGDEINAIEKGKNYGHPVISYGHDYSGKPLGDGKTSTPGLEQPVYFWTPDVAPAGMTFYSGTLFPAWQGDLFVGALVGRDLVRLVLSGDRVVGEERLLVDLKARIRGVEQGPDGALYVLVDGNDGKILKLVPKK
jgi:glucose/arabinose dehydrogenase